VRATHRDHRAEFTELHWAYAWWDFDGLVHPLILRCASDGGPDESDDKTGGRVVIGYAKRRRSGMIPRIERI
jgi:hypothetical protein